MNCYELTNHKTKGLSRDWNEHVLSHCRELERWASSCHCHSAVNGQMAYDSVSGGKLETQGDSERDARGVPGGQCQ